MYNLKAFLGINALANNTPENISPVGELSNVAMTYAIEKGYYSNTDYPNVELISFTSKKDDATISVPANYSQLLLKIGQWAFNLSIAGELNDDEEAFRLLFMAEYQDVVRDVEIGKMVLAKTSWLPSYIKFVHDTSGEENRVQVWLSDPAFQSQYDDYQIVVIPPAEPVDSFQQVEEKVAELLSKFNVPNLHERVLEKTGGEPYTYIVSKTYDWHDRNDETSTLPTVWSVAIYGRAGNNPTVIKNALAEYILANSAYSRPDWVPVFPDIFTSTEFAIVPMWHKQSVPDETVRGALYSPIVPYDESLTIAQKYINYDNPDFVRQNLEISTVHYKSLAIVTSGGIENRDDVFKLSEMFKDYAMLVPGGPDFNRMSPRTVAWVRKLLTGIIIAEEMDEYTIIDSQYSRIEKDGRTYIGFDYEDVLYLVLTRLSMDEVEVTE